ncbi:hypothetical protein HBH98_063170 [Parastagonospora nodorum]|nr:hypothetical protein HBH98_063170 [Parastagonospora nodorum]KAH4379456.1 hypothetical protein HBH97_096930 [Parastagonospora nodorum]KAH5415156.1 hypothetical protein HBI32_115390 [Parastagonospora nodorum]
MQSLPLPHTDCQTHATNHHTQTCLHTTNPNPRIKNRISTFHPHTSITMSSSTSNPKSTAARAIDKSTSKEKIHGTSKSSGPTSNPGSQKKASSGKKSGVAIAKGDEVTMPYKG